MNIQIYHYRQMFISIWTTIMLAFALGACGNQDSTLTVNPKLPIVAATSTLATGASPTPVPTSTPAANIEPDLARIREALSREDYETAAGIGRRLLALQPASPAVAQLLAESYRSWGQKRLAQAQGQSSVLREAFEHYSDGLRVVPPTDKLKADLEQELRYAQSILEASLALDQFLSTRTSKPDDLAAQQQQGEVALQRITALVDLPAALPGRDELRMKGLLAVAQLEEQVADASKKGSSKQLHLAKAQELCRMASTLLPESDEARSAQDCVKRVGTALARTKPQTGGFSARADRSYTPSNATGRFESCIEGHVVRNGQGIKGAAGNVNNGPQNSFAWTSGADGAFRVCGLGASQWTVVLYYVPPDLNNLSVRTLISVNGAPDQVGAVTFAAQ